MQGITLPSLIIDIDRDRIPRDPEAVGELRREEMIKSMPSDISPSPNPSLIADCRLEVDMVSERDRNQSDIELDTQS